MSLIHWPAIIVHHDNAELVFVGSESMWDSDGSLQQYYSELDYLVDCDGNTFTLTDRKNDKVLPHPRNVQLPLSDLLELVKVHASLIGSCCAAKLYATTISDVMKIMEALSEDE